jgi:outer membrane protein insertion porin family
MSFHPPVKFILLLFLIALVATTGCVYPRKYQPNKPFVFKTNINIQGNLSANEKQDLKTRLENQLDDSLKTKEVTILPLRKNLVKPPAFDTSAAIHSQEYMKALLYARGYYKATVTWDSSIVFKKDQQRVTVDFTVIPGKGFKFDSINYRLEDSVLQALALARRGNALIKSGDPYSVEIISAELDRLVDVFRNQGYYKFSKDDLIAERDTVLAALIDPSLDPFERLRLLQEAQQRLENPLMNLVIRLRDPGNTRHFRKYYINSVGIYADLPLLEDSIAPFKVDTINSIVIYSQFNKFKPAFIASRTTLRPKEMFRYRNYVRTYSNYTQLDAWTQAGIDITEARDSSPNLDVIVRLYPEKKQDISVTFDGSYNTGDVIAAGNLFGVGVNFGLSNRNVAKQAITSSTNIRTGVELGKNFIQTIQTSLSHTINFPKFIVPFGIRIKNTDSLLFQRTQLNFNASYTNRRTFYELRSLNASWGYNFTKRGRRTRRTNHSWFYSPLNIEYVQLNNGEKLNQLLASAPNLRFSFNTGLVISQQLVYKYQASKTNKRNVFQLSFEESGGVFGLIKKLDGDGKLFRYAKIDADYRHYIDFKKSGWAFRLYGGIGVPYGNDEMGNRETQLPFFKAFYAGGPYSMRGWQVRQLGVGSSRYFDTLASGPIDRFGDIQLEANAEYRFDIGTIFGIKLKSAIFTDVGNIWFRTSYDKPEFAESVLTFKTLYRDLAISSGTSLRVDFDYFLIRFDWAYRIKNPYYAQVNNGWFQDIKLLNGQFQLGINYPF